MTLARASGANRAFIPKAAGGTSSMLGRCGSRRRLLMQSDARRITFIQEFDTLRLHRRLDGVYNLGRACSMKSLAIGLIVRPFSVTTPAGIDCLGNWTGRTLIGITFALNCRNIRATPKTYPEGHSATRHRLVPSPSDCL